MKQKLPIEMTETAFTAHYMETITSRIFQPLILIQPSAIMAGCARHIWRSIVPDYTLVWFYPASCMSIWQKLTRSAGIAWNG